MKSNSSNNHKENIITTLRHLTRRDELQVEFDINSENNFFSWDQNIFRQDSSASSFKECFALLPEASKLEQENDDGLLKLYRPAADLCAAYILFHEKEIHQKNLLNKNFDEEEQKIFANFEKIRVLLRLRNYYLGAFNNVFEKLTSELSFFCEDERSDDLSLLLLENVIPADLIKKMSEKNKDFFLHLKQKSQKKFSQKVLNEIKNLAEKITNQNDFALSVAKLLELIKKEQKKQTEENSQNKNQQTKNDLNNFGQENIEDVEEKISPENTEEKNELNESQKSQEFIEEINFKKSSDDEVTGELENSSFENDKIRFKNAYKVFTSKFDETIFPQKLVAKNELQTLRDQLDLRLLKLSSISKKMNLKLKKKLMAKREFFLERDATRGILDRKKLSRLVVDPMFEEIWTTKKTHQQQDTVLTILLDNSGSMRGNPIVMSAMACEIIAQILEKFSIKTEIIGFTTADWKGGRARKLWEIAGREKNPGRLNELRHIIYKSFNQSFKKSKINLGLMLKEGVLKENIDGEALLFARFRLMQQSEKRKILLVISDGTPIDDSTNSSNEGDILSDHLKHVIKKIEQQSKIEIVGIGIGHAAEDFYRNSITIKSLDELGDVMIEKIATLL